MSDIFISYKREEQPIARILADALEQEGWTVWWDPKLRAGEDFDQIIEKALNEASCVIVLWSKQSLNSDYVRAEASEALEQKKLVPVAIEDVVLPFRFKRLHTAKLINWHGTKSIEFHKLVADIKETITKTSNDSIGINSAQRNEPDKFHDLENTEYSKADSTQAEKLKWRFTIQRKYLSILSCIARNPIKYTLVLAATSDFNHWSFFLKCIALNAGIVAILRTIFSGDIGRIFYFNNAYIFSVSGIGRFFILAILYAATSYFLFRIFIDRTRTIKEFAILSCIALGATYLVLTLAEIASAAVVFSIYTFVPGREYRHQRIWFDLIFLIHVFILIMYWVNVLRHFWRVRLRLAVFLFGLSALLPISVIFFMFPPLYPFVIY